MAPDFGRSSQLESAILNLVVNARDAMVENGKLTIETGNAFIDENYSQQNAAVPVGQYVLIAVSDTGFGMAREVQAKSPPAAWRQADRPNHHFEAVLVSMLTTWTRRLTGSIGAFGSFGLVLP